jgi:chromosomal replication initiator protein
LELPRQPELTAAWREIRAELRRVVGESTYEIWLAPVEPRAWDGSVLLLEAPLATQPWLSKRFERILESCAQSVLGGRVRISFTGPGESATRHWPVTPDDGDQIQGFNPRYSFDQFIIGDSNRLAHAAALAVAEAPGRAYNPLFLHASPGLGKTHLLHAIGNYMHAFSGGVTVRYTTAEAFTNHFVTALQSRSLDRFKHAYRDVDVLLMDDVQFLASKAKTEEEFFHTFSALYDSGRQLVLTCNCLPNELVTIDERLRQRFASGLVAAIGAPDFDTRVVILRKRAALDRVAIADQDVLRPIAERITTSIRAIEGALIRIVAYHSLTGRAIDNQLVSTVLDSISPQLTPSTPSIADIQATVAARYRISVAELVSNTRAARVMWPRQVAIHLARQLSGSSLQAIGAAFGGRNHATVLHACRRVSERVRTDPDAAFDLQALTTALRPNGSTEAVDTLVSPAQATTSPHAAGDPGLIHSPHPSL